MAVDQETRQSEQPVGPKQHIKHARRELADARNAADPQKEKASIYSRHGHALIDELHDTVGKHVGRIHARMQDLLQTTRRHGHKMLTNRTGIPYAMQPTANGYPLYSRESLDPAQPASLPPEPTPQSYAKRPNGFREWYRQTNANFEAAVNEPIRRWWRNLRKRR